jgi:eukaryotic translation initiation factor 2C
MIKTKARLLPNPEIQFGNMKHNPGVSGKWDLRQKRFLKANKQILSNWVVGHFIRGNNPLSPAQLEAWIDGFMKAYKQHGGLVNNLPQTCELREDIAQSVKKMYDKGLVYGSEPQLLIIIVNEKDAFGYSRIKKSCDCRFGVPSQVLWSGHCSQNRPQYHSNVLMKVNAKLGGTTNRAVPTSKATALRPSSAIIGVDVTHAPKGTFTPSIAAMSLSNDTLGVRYMGNCQINGEGPFIAKEIIDIKIMREILEPLMKEWIRDLGQGRDYPHNIYYFRDGVSDSELHHVLNTEVPAVRRIMAESTNVDPWPGKITVVVANKRHHLRAWPNPKDVKNRDQHGNPLPGTLIDRDVVGPHGWDFLLYAHTALQGTARPVHYKVLLDEIGHKPEELENMIYEQSYQYIRSTTSVGIHPAIYYAHLITARARHHEDRPADMGPQLSRDTRQARTPQLKNLLQKRNKTESDEELLKEVMPKRKLLQFKESANRLMYSMWFV